MTKYPQVQVKLVGEDGNIFAIMGRIANAMKRERISQDEIKAFIAEVQSSKSYDDALCVCMNWVNTDSPFDELEENEIEDLQEEIEELRKENEELKRMLKPPSTGKAP